MKPIASGNRRGFSFIEFVIVCAVLCVVAVLLLPSLAKSQRRCCRLNCVNNLKQVSLSFRQWGLDNQDRMPMAVTLADGGAKEMAATGNVAFVFQVMSNELNTPKILWCPTDVRNLRADSFTNGLQSSNITYFVGLDANETRPQMFLTGDDDILVGGKPANAGVVTITTNSTIGFSRVRHDRQGNVALADGSVFGYSNPQLNAALRNTGTNVNRLAFP